MGLDAKGRNFSAPRLTPGKSSESLVYGSPNMLKDQERKISVMEARARRYGFGGIKSVNNSTLGASSSLANSLSNVSFGTTSGSSTDSYTAKPITVDSNPNHSPTTANSARSYNAARARVNNKAIGWIVAFFIIFMFGPMIMSILGAIISVIFDSTGSC